MPGLEDIIRKNCERYILEEPDPRLRFSAIKLLNDDSVLAKAELKDRMGSFLQFGTAGLRGKMEAGYNRMNLVSVYRFSQGFAQFLANKSLNNSLVVIGFDGRENSKEYANEVATVLSSIGVRVFLFDFMVPTPLCAFAVKNLSASFGIMITASHNPAYDNGIKLFEHTSAQCNKNELVAIENYMPNVTLRYDFYRNLDENKAKQNITKIEQKIIDAYFLSIKEDRFFAPEQINNNIHLVYTPLHGVGKNFFVRVLADLGFDKIHLVNEQAEPDGSFSTLEFPNPEEEHTLDLAHHLASEKNIQWVLANDPDADRLQASSVDEQGHFRRLSGNEMGVILGFFAIQKSLARANTPIVVSTIVSSRMLKVMADKLGAKYFDTLTGFSNISHTGLREQKNLNGEFVFGYEEAIGFLVGQSVLDKDGITAGARFAEVAGYLNKHNITVWQFLDELFVKFGLFINQQWSIRFDGVFAADKMSACMDKVRMLKLSYLEEALSLGTLKKIDLTDTNLTTPYEGLAANVVIFESIDGCRLIVRPSGTEPKIKFYLEKQAEKVLNTAMLAQQKIVMTERVKKLELKIKSLFG